MKTNTPMDDKIRAKLYVKNEYGYEHQHADHPTFTWEETQYLSKYGFRTRYKYADGTEVPIHPMCTGCQARHILKYKNHPDVKDGKPFKVRCNGVPGELPPGTRNAIMRFSTERNVDVKYATKIMKATVDPVAWAELMFNFDDSSKSWKLRWYQKEQLRCSSKRIVIREGRRTGKTFLMALKLLYYAFNHQVTKGISSEGQEIMGGPDIIVVTPFMAQLTNIFDEIERLVKTNVDLASKITTQHAGNLYVKTPFFRMEFANGASIKGFVTGVEIRQDGSAAGSLRGQSANIIYLDEMDMIQPDVLEKVIIPILATSEDTMFFATSTPIGKAGKFYDLCMNRADFKEDYLPSSVLPHWDTFKAELEFTDAEDDAFVSEYMAQFIESASGVFKASYVYKAMADYTYDDSEPHNAKWWNEKARVGSRSDLFTVIGVDWNKNAGTEFVVVRYDPVRNWWWVAEAFNVSPSQFNSIKFKEEMIRLNYKWKPDFIYADEGYGHHIIDDLLWEAHRLKTLGNHITVVDQQTMKLTDRLKKFNFSGKVELMDPITGLPFEKTGKEFLVENAIRVFETERISFPSTDRTLVTQLLNYVVLRRNISNNRPVYGMKSEKVGDHRLDALMLALGGLFLEKHPLYSPNARMISSLPTLLKKEELERRAKQEDPGPLAKGIPGLNLTLTRIVRGGSEDEDNKVRHIQSLEQQNKQPSWTPKERSDFPTNRQSKPQSVFEELWNRTKGVKGYDDDTRALYEARGGRKEKASANSGLFVMRRPKRHGGR